jgi:exonuclease III
MTEYVGCWNVKTMWLDQDEGDVIRDLEERRIKLCVVTEGHWVGQGVRRVGGYYILFSGHPTKHREGVGFVLSKALYEAWKEAGGWWTPISSRMATIRIPLQGSRFMTIVGVYAPTNTTKYEAETVAMYDKVQEVWDAIPKGEMRMVVGDFNARVGTYDKSFSSAVGRYGMGEINSNGRKLRDFCIKNDMAVMGTFFPHKKIHQYTWEDAYKNRYMVDHFVVHKKWKGCVRDVRTVSHGYHSNADHRLVRMRIDLALARTSRRRGSRYTMLDRNKFNEKQVVAAYTRQAWGI